MSTVIERLPVFRTRIQQLIEAFFGMGADKLDNVPFEEPAGLVVVSDR
jgi:hypothetical protein